MKILFLTRYEYMEPIGIMTLSAFLKQNGHECDMVDLNLSKDYLQEIRVFNPDIIGYSVTTGREFFYLNLNRDLKDKFSFMAVFGGPHATFFPEIIEEEGVDVVCRGEGEYALLELAENFARGKALINIKNLWVKHNGEIYRNELRPFVEDLDTLPFIDRDIAQKYKHYRRIRRRMVLTGRGCPFDCSYCFNHSYSDLYKGKGKRIRRRSVDNVIRELKEINRKFSPDRFQFIDDLFILDESWCLDFSRRYAEEIKKPFVAYTRVNLVTDELVKNLKQAGCVALLYAIESGNDYIRNEVLNRNISDKQISDAVNIFKKYKLKTFSQNMVGLPDETLEMAFDTLRMNIKCQPDFAWCSIFQPFPKTKLWFRCKEKNYLTDADIGENYYKKSVLNIDNKRELENLHHLFSMAVSFPRLLPLFRQLIKFPLGYVYYIIWHLHRVYSYLFKVPWLYLSEVLILEKPKGSYVGIIKSVLGIDSAK